MSRSEVSPEGERRAPFDLTRSALQLLFVGLLVAGSFWILRPFLLPVAWASTIVVSTWPLHQRLRAWSGDRDGVAVAAMTAALLLVLVLPLYLATSTVLENTDRIAGWAEVVARFAGAPPPAWIESIPLVGARLAEGWRDIAATAPADLATRVRPYAMGLLGWFAGQVGGVGLMFVQSLLTVVIAAILFASGESAARGVDRFARRLGGERGSEAVRLAAQAVRAVALGVVVTAFVQSCLGGIGLGIAGVPFAAILTALMFILGVAQLGPLPVLIPAVIWTYWSEGGAWGTALAVWSVLVGVMDNFLRPVLIRRGADLPLLLIFSGVIGGLIAFGVIGLFIGPVLLAVAYTLLVSWIEDAPPPA